MQRTYPSVQEAVGLQLEVQLHGTTRPAGGMHDELIRSIDVKLGMWRSRCPSPACATNTSTSIHRARGRPHHGHVDHRQPQVHTRGQPWRS